MLSVRWETKIWPKPKT